MQDRIAALRGNIVSVYMGNTQAVDRLIVCLLARGHAIGEPDGLVGSLTRRAIRDEQARLGVAQDGRAGMKLLRALRAEAPAVPR